MIVTNPLQNVLTFQTKRPPKIIFFLVITYIQRIDKKVTHNPVATDRNHHYTHLIDEKYTLIHSQWLFGIRRPVMGLFLKIFKIRFFLSFIKIMNGKTYHTTCTAYKWLCWVCSRYIRHWVIRSYWQCDKAEWKEKSCFSPSLIGFRFLPRFRRGLTSSQQHVDVIQWNDSDDINHRAKVKNVSRRSNNYYLIMYSE